MSPQQRPHLHQGPGGRPPPPAEPPSTSQRMMTAGNPVGDNRAYPQVSVTTDFKEERPSRRLTHMFRAHSSAPAPDSPSPPVQMSSSSLSCRDIPLPSSSTTLSPLQGSLTPCMPTCWPDAPTWTSHEHLKRDTHEAQLQTPSPLSPRPHASPVCLSPSSVNGSPTDQVTLCGGPTLLFLW